MKEVDTVWYLSEEADRVWQDEVVPRLEAEAREFADELWAGADDRKWTRALINHRVLDPDDDPRFGDDATEVRYRFVLEILAERLRLEFPSRSL